MWISRVKNTWHSLEFGSKVKESSFSPLKLREICAISAAETETESASLLPAFSMVQSSAVKQRPVDPISVEAPFLRRCGSRRPIMISVYDPNDRTTSQQTRCLSKRSIKAASAEASKLTFVIGLSSYLVGKFFDLLIADVVVSALEGLDFTSDDFPLRPI